MSTLASDSFVSPSPKYDAILPVTDTVYDPYTATADALSPEAATERVHPDGIDLVGLDYTAQTQLKFRLETGPNHGETPSIEHAPDDWEGRLVDVAYGGVGARTQVTYEWMGGTQTTAVKPIPNGDPGGYSMTGLGAIVEFYDVSPVALADLDVGLPVPIRRCSSGTRYIDYQRLREHFLETVPWGGFPDVFIAHPPWRPSFVTATGTIETIYDDRELGQWVSLNPKYRGRFSP